MALTVPMRPSSFPSKHHSLGFPGIGYGSGRVCVSSAPLLSSTTSGKDLSLSETQLPHLKNGASQNSPAACGRSDACEGLRSAAAPVGAPAQGVCAHLALGFHCFRNTEGATQSTRALVRHDCHLSPSSSCPPCPPAHGTCLLPAGLQRPTPEGTIRRVGCYHPHAPAVYTSLLQQAMRRIETSLCDLRF